MNDELAGRLGRNIKQLRQTRGLTQTQMAKLSLLPRATWANLESGAANPTLSVLHRVALALQSFHRGAHRRAARRGKALPEGNAAHPRAGRCAGELTFARQNPGHAD